MNIEPDQVPVLASLLSSERLGPLTKVTGSQISAIELHQETLRVGTDLMMVIATVEIALRNTVSENLSQHFGVPTWLTQPPVAFRWRDIERSKVTAAVDSARRAEYSKMTQAQKAALDALAYPNGRPPSMSHLARAKARRRQIQVTEGKVIAELTLYFWKRLFGPDYEATLWKPTLRRTFPDKRLARADVAKNLEVIYQTRNRLAHHEPVLHARFNQALASILFIGQRIGQTSPRDDTELLKLLETDVKRVQERAGALHNRLAAFRVTT